MVIPSEDMVEAEWFGRCLQETDGLFHDACVPYHQEVDMRHVLLVEDHLVIRKAYAVVLAFGSSGT